MSTEASHRQILKSTSIVGGSSVITLAIRMIGTKVLALLLGPLGIGLLGLYDNIVNLARIISGLGLGSSGVRQIAAAAGSGDQRVIATTVTTLRRISLFLGIAGAAVLFLLREQVSWITFGDTTHSRDIGVLSLVLLFSVVNVGQGALLQGMRRIGDLAKMNVIGAFCGVLLSIPAVYFWKERGIAIYLVASSAIAVFVSWMYARRVRIEKVEVPWRSLANEARGMLKLGVVFLFSALLSVGALYILRVLVIRQEGPEAAGQFHAANALSLVYVSFILQAMGTDFYPRLTAAANDNAKCNQLVNEQTEVSLLLCLPGVLATLAFAPWLIRLFYSGEFGMAVEILCLQVAGMFLRVASWPMGFILMAKGCGKTYACTEFTTWTAYVLMVWGGLKWFGLPGTGMAFTASYVFTSVLIYCVVMKVSGFRWTRRNIQLVTLGVLALGTALAAHFLLPPLWAAAVGGLLTLVAGLGCLKVLVRMVGAEKVNQYLRKLRLPVSIPVVGTVAAKGE